MVNTGAKGSTVNQSQVSCALGQQALEGRRVPRLASGRTLPSFAPYDPNPRADGFIMDRFLTGIRPQEYYFHCMAGREGLVDTAVKTSRSGYLQRCLVKHLEELKVCYDSTVRNGEGGVVQFLYGEDGLDPTKAAFLDCENKTFEYLARNYDAVKRRNTPLTDASIEFAANDARRDQAVQDGKAKLRVGSFVYARRLRVGSRWVRGTLCRGWFGADITAVNEDGTFDIRYVKDGKRVKDVPRQVNFGRCGSEKTTAESSLCVILRPSAPDPTLTSARTLSGQTLRVGSSGVCVAERVASATADVLEKSKTLQELIHRRGIKASEYGQLIAGKYSSALCAPGEAVGSIAAQSVGEPSTQMTLNTFHLAGSGANVTLGIPRLREIIMTASKELKTPTMSIPLDPDVTDRQARRVARAFSRLTLNELVASHKGVAVTERLVQNETGKWTRSYHVTLSFHPAERIKEAFGLQLEDIAAAIQESFNQKITALMKAELRRAGTDADVKAYDVDGAMTDNAQEKNSEDEPSSGKGKGDRDELGEDGIDDNVDGDDEMGEEDGADATRQNRGEDSELYGGMDDEDREAVAAEQTTDGRHLFDDDEAEEGEEDEESDGGRDTPATTTKSVSFQLIDDTSTEPVLDHRRNQIHLPPLFVDPAARPLLMVGLVERAAASTTVRSKRGIEEAYINDEDGRGRCLQTAGVNFSEFWKLKFVDHNKLASNDTWAICQAYGVEAGRNNIVEQIRAVFGVYGISVDPRHLSLIADYMTFEGGYKPMNRIGMNDISSPFLQMSFETTANFMTTAAMQNMQEPLMSPSANIVMGRPIRHGTGAFDVLSAVS